MATILILDDRATNREFLVTLLRYDGHTLLEAVGAEEALAIVGEMCPDLVIADVLMPDVDGFEFVRRLRAEPPIAHTRVMFYTAAYLESEARALAAACGVAHVLTKPGEPQVILETVRKLLTEPATAVAPPQAAAFAREHERLLLDKLAQKVDELEEANAGLETLNAELEDRVAQRTAELAEANARLRELNAFKDNLLAVASHDLRSPLGAIQNTAELLLEEPGMSDEARRLHQSILGSARHLIDMVNKLLDLSRLEAGKIVLEPLALHASDVARRSLEAIATTAQAKAIATELIVDHDEVPVLADWMKLTQICDNLLSNALKFTPAGGRVTVTVSPAPAGMRLSVADTGLGISADELPHLFEKFRQFHTRGTADERGSGLGLAIVRQLVELHGGSIEVTSEAGRGTTVVVQLPAADSEHQST